jgi:hypothetical protein
LSFDLPPNATNITLCSRVFIPIRTLADNSDLRNLGLDIGRLILNADVFNITGFDARVIMEAD